MVRIAAASEKHFLLSFSYKCSCNIQHAHADTGIIDLASQFPIVPVGFEATRRENSPKAAILLPEEREVYQSIRCLIHPWGYKTI